MDFLINKKLKEINFTNTLFDVPYDDKIKIIDLYVNNMFDKNWSMHIMSTFLNNGIFNKYDLNGFLIEMNAQLLSMLIKYIPKITIETINHFFVFEDLTKIKFGSYDYVKKILSPENSHKYTIDIQSNVIKDILISLYSYKGIKKIKLNNLSNFYEKKGYKYKNFANLKQLTGIMNRNYTYQYLSKCKNSFFNEFKNIFNYELRINPLFANKDSFYRYLILIKRLNLMSTKNIKIEKNLFSEIAIKLGNCKNILNNIFGFFYNGFTFDEYKSVLDSKKIYQSKILEDKIEKTPDNIQVIFPSTNLGNLIILNNPKYIHPYSLKFQYCDEPRIIFNSKNYCIKLIHQGAYGHKVDIFEKVK